MRKAMATAMATVGLLALSLAGCSTDGDADATSATTAPPPPVVDWATFGFDLANSRYNPDEQVITTDSVGTLAEAWTVDAGTGMSSTPSVVDGVVYFADWDGVVHAVDADTGDELWTSEVARTVMASVTVVGDAAYVADNGNVYRLDAATGEQQWASVTSDHPLAITPSSPVVVGNHVLQAVASGELMIPLEDYSFSGFLASFDTETGAEQWRVMFTPDDETGGAGVGVWSTPSVDIERGVAYIGTGNTYEPPAAELSDSIVAIDLETGEVVWSTQFTYPDVWSTGNLGGVDGDVGAGPNLWEADGRDLVGAGDKTGMFHALDRDTGDVVWETKLTNGSVLGGVIGTSAHGDGRLYVASNVGNPENNGPTGASQVMALDDSSGEILWSVEIEGAVYAPVTGAAGVIYVGSTSGVMYAFDAATGEQLWTFTAPDQVGSGAAVVNGTVYWGYGFALLGSGSGTGALMAFRPTAGAGTAPDSSTTVIPADETLGARIYRTSCASCHGGKGQGGVGPELVGVADRLSVDEHLTVVRKGKGIPMPAFEDVLTPEEIDAVVEHERTAMTGSN